MFTKEEQKLAPKVVQAIEKITQSARREWEWKPEVGEWCLYKSRIDLLLQDEDGHWYFGIRRDRLFGELHTLANPVCFYGIANLIPLLHWEKLEDILEDLGFFLEVEKIGRKDCKCLILKGSGGPETECVAAGSGKTRQEAVMRAVIELAKRMTK